MRLLVACVLAASATGARAESRIEIRANGNCPSADAIARVLPDRAPAGGPVELAIEEIEGGVIVRATSATGALEARLEGNDCAVLATAVAAIADAWFVELASRAMPRAAPAMLTQPSGVDGPEPDRVSAPRWNLAAGHALVIADRGSRSQATQIEVGWWLHRHARLRARVDFGNSMVLDDIVQRDAWHAVVAVAPRLDRGRLWLEVAGGAGLVISRVERMAGADGIVRAHGALAGAAGAGIRLGAGASLRVDLDGLLYPVRDVYTLQTSAVARSPRAELAAGLGLEIAFGARSR
jgi:hypothetical protein